MINLNKQRVFVVPYSLKMRAWLLLVLFCLVCSVNGDTESDVIVLTDDNFEHHTQASTGSTTGNWFVEFYAPWCGHCKNMEGEWEELAHELKGELSVAKIDSTVNSATTRRFNISSFPTIKYLVHGKVYDYKGSRTVSPMREYVRGAFRTDSHNDIPHPLNWSDLLIEDLQSTIADVKAIFDRKAEAGVMIGGIGLFLGVSLAAIIFIAVDRCRGGSVNIAPPPQSPPAVYSPSSTSAKRNKKD